MKLNLITRFAAVLCVLLMLMLTICSCDYTPSGSTADKQNQINAANELQSNQATPTDIEYSLERYNLIRRAYWVNGQREKARTLPCEIDLPEGYVVLFAESGAVVTQFAIRGKVSSLNSYLTPDSEYYSSYSSYNRWLADIDGTYGTNDGGIFFFTEDGNYIEWTGTYLYSDIYFKVNEPIVKYEAIEGTDN